MLEAQRILKNVDFPLKEHISAGEANTRGSPDIGGMKSYYGLSGEIN